MVEISAGVEVPLRGADEVGWFASLQCREKALNVVEHLTSSVSDIATIHNFLVSMPTSKFQTWKAVHIDFFTPAFCVACSNDIFCIADAEFVICPHCKVITSLNGEGETSGCEKLYGVGLGFTFENLYKWQSEIVRGRKEQSKSGSLDKDTRAYGAKWM
jgi:hypothetical protein